MSARTTHPMVLIAATALTIFSILGSALITGLIPSAHSERQGNEASADMHKANAEVVEPNEQVDAKQKNTVSGKISQGVVVPQRAISQDAISTERENCQECGKVVSIRRIKPDGEATGIGAVAGGVTGGVIGNQIGKGQGNVLMTILGVGGGAYAGHTIEKKINAETAYVIKVKMANGDYKTVRQHQEPTFVVGDEVKFKNGSLMSA
jgi:outer membrane lipoprotein SlyB